MMAEIELKKQMEQEVQKAEKTSKQQEFIFLKPIYAVEDMIGQVGRKTKQTWMDRYSPEAVRKWLAVSRWMRVWMIVQVFVTVLSIGNYVSLTYMANRDQGRSV
jgi:cell division protein FtsX